MCACVHVCAHCFALFIIYMYSVCLSDMHVHVYMYMHSLRFVLSGLAPGTYQLMASHSIWKVAEVCVHVHVHVFIILCSFCNDIMMTSFNV